MDLFWFISLTILTCFGLVVFIGAPYVPTKKSFVQQAFDDLYKLSDKDVLVDIGSGDGFVLREASKRGARAVGFDINPILVLISKLVSIRDRNIDVKLNNFWRSNLPKDVTVIYLFAVQRDMKRINIWIQKQVDIIQAPVFVITLGSTFTNLREENNIEPYHLYRFYPSLHKH